MNPGKHKAEKNGRRMEMPIMQYRCEDCGARFKAFVSRTENADNGSHTCERCGSTKIKSMFSVIGDGGSAQGIVPLACDDCGSCESCGASSVCGYR